MNLAEDIFFLDRLSVGVAAIASGPIMSQVVPYFTGRHVSRMEGFVLGIGYFGSWFIGSLVALPILAVFMVFIGPAAFFPAGLVQIGFVAYRAYRRYRDELQLSPQMARLMLVLQSILFIACSAFLVALVHATAFLVSS
jgi:hypothetical protein